MIGRTLATYRVLSQLGVGGMGEVYRARDEKLDRDVAIKVLPAGLLGDETARSRFRREAKALSRLTHPHVSTLLDFGSVDGVDYLVMELVPGWRTLTRSDAGSRVTISLSPSPSKSPAVICRLRPSDETELV